MNCIRPITEYGIDLIFKDGIEFFRTKKSINHFSSDEIVSRYITHKSEYYRDSNDKVKFLNIKYRMLY